MARRGHKKQKRGKGGQAAATTQRVAIPKTVQKAIRAHQKGRLDKAERLYKRVLAVDKNQPDALHFLGVLRHQQGRSQSAIELIQRSLDSDATNINAYNNLGNVLTESARLQEAIAAYRRAIELQPDFADAHHNLGSACRRARDWAGAAQAYQEAIRLRPYDAASYRRLGMMYYALDRIEEATAVYSDWLAREPDNSVARHMYAACTQTNIPSRASDDFVQATFDRFASSFDSVLQGLDYKAPALIADALEDLIKTPQPVMRVLDAGCGTGLCGPLLRPYAKLLRGVDLSTAMIDKAAERQVYDDLLVAELTEFLEQSRERYELIASADTLCYFGDLTRVLAAIHLRLEPGGVLAFTVEAKSDNAEGDGYALGPHGRYAHSEDHVREAIVAVSLEVGAVNNAVLRRERDKPVAGLVVVARQAEYERP